MIVVRLNVLSGLFVFDPEKAGDAWNGHQLPLNPPSPPLRR